jgi:hypothetical protein
MTMEFLGCTHVKPIRRQWEIPVQTPGQYRYNPPGGGSANLEEITYYLLYLIALSTLRLTLGNRSVEFMTTPLLAEIRKEPHCCAARRLIWKTNPVFGRSSKIFCELRASKIHYDASHVVERRKVRGCCEFSVTNRPDAMRIASPRQLY